MRQVLRAVACMVGVVIVVLVLPLLPLQTAPYQSGQLSFWLYCLQQFYFAAVAVIAFPFQSGTALPLRRYVHVCSYVVFTIIFVIAVVCVFFTTTAPVAPPWLALAGAFFANLAVFICCFFYTLLVLIREWKLREPGRIHSESQSSLDLALLTYTEDGYQVSVLAKDQDLEFELYQSVAKPAFEAPTQDMVLLRHPMKQFFLILTFVVAHNCLFAFLHWFEQTDISEPVLRFLVFCAVIFVFRTVFKFVNLQTDIGKRGGVPVYLYTEFICDVYYWVNYRLLFERLNSWWFFALLLAVQVITEWLQYPLRATLWYFNLTRRWSDSVRAKLLQCCGADVLFGRSTFAQWLPLVSFACGLRWLVMFAVTLSWFVQLVTVTYGNNQLNFNFGYQSLLANSSLAVLCVRVAIAMSVETINTAVMEGIFWARRGVSLRVRVLSLFCFTTFCVLFVMDVGGIMCTSTVARLCFTPCPNN